ncbi:MAG TPA: hypothetical protein VGN00_01215 [Puia sp.]|jgi:hypothetical protein
MQVMTSHSFSLETLIQDGSAPAVHRLSEDLFKALESIHAEKRWFADISEKDIFCNRDGRFSVVVSGNTVPRSELPDTAVYASKDYWMPVFSYLIGRVRLELRPCELPGILFNYLQTMLLILRVRLVFVDQEGYYNSTGLFDQLPIILDKLVPEYRALFTRLLTKADKTPGPSDLRQIKTLFIEKVVLRPIDSQVSPATRPTAAKPIVKFAGLPAAHSGAIPSAHSEASPSSYSGAIPRSHSEASPGSYSGASPGPHAAARSFKRSTDYLQNGDFVVAVILAVALTFSVWLWSGH